MFKSFFIKKLKNETVPANKTLREEAIVCECVDICEPISNSIIGEEPNEIKKEPRVTINQTSYSWQKLLELHKIWNPAGGVSALEFIEWVVATQPMNEEDTAAEFWQKPNCQELPDELTW